MTDTAEPATSALARIVHLGAHGHFRTVGLGLEQEITGAQLEGVPSVHRVAVRDLPCQDHVIHRPQIRQGTS